ncbi:MAG: nucleotidyltransferase family protein [Lachnospiraceae bacterium]|nr:nucleotidyltransferase family protein [Lachnospiraceae bacterium]
MSKELYEEMMKLVIELCGCVVNGKVPDGKKLQGVDLETLYAVSGKHLLAAIVAEALERAGIRNEAFIQAKAKAIRKNILFDAERGRILERMEQNGIWYMPLKGAILKELYPGMGLRQMADNDILFEAEKAEIVKAFMEDLGYETISFGHSNHDIYHKDPVLNFEMHTALYGPNHQEEFYLYYRNVKKRLVKDPGNACGYHFRPEDFYVYMIAHEYKHYMGGGTGVRSLLDIYVYLNHYKDKLDTAYTGRELEKLGLVEFEQTGRQLAEKLFGKEAVTSGNAYEVSLSETEKEMYDYILSSGTYGTSKNSIVNRMRRELGKNVEVTKKRRWRYIWARVFPPREKLLPYYPAAKYKVLLPFVYVFRIVRGVTSRRKRVFTEWKVVRDQKEL